MQIIHCVHLSLLTDGTLTTEYSYDNVGNLITQKTTGRVSLSFEYTYDLNGSITAALEIMLKQAEHMDKE